MTSDRAIIRILNEQISSYKMLHGLLHKERECLIDIDSDSVDELSKEKDTIIMRLRLLEEERQRLVAQFALEKGVSSDINLEQLGKITGNSSFGQLRSHLLSLLQSIEEMNRFNAILIDRSLNHVKSGTDFFKLFKTELKTQSTGVLLSRET